MAIEPYDPCPCGSGNKLKFCCAAIVRDMEKVIGLQNAGQNHQALKQLEALEKDNKDNIWILSMKSIVLLNEQRVEEARTNLDRLLELSPDHAVGIACQAWVRLRLEGYAKAKPVIYRALQRSMQAAPAVISALLQTIANFMEQTGCVLSMRQHMALALRYANPESREQLFVELMELDNDAELPYPLRGVHEMANFEPPEDKEKDYRTAMRLAFLGCFGMAAKMFDDLTESCADSAELHYNAGLCHAWDGDEAPAADALHRAAELFENFDDAVEAETIAQLLDANDSNFSTAIMQSSMQASEISTILTKLDEHPQFVRMHTEEEMASSRSYQVISVEPSEDAVAEDVDFSTLPQILGSVTFMDETSQALAFGMEGEPLEAVRELLSSVAGDLVSDEISEETGDPIEMAVDYLSDVESILRFDRYLGADILPGQVRRLRHRFQTEAIDNVWLQEPQSTLDNQSPTEATGNEELKVALSAAVVALEAQMGRAQMAYDFAGLRDRLQVSSPATITIGDDDAINSFSNMKLFRIDIGQLSDDRMSEVLNRSLVVGESQFLEAVLLEFANRPSIHENVELERVYEGLVNIAIAKMDDEAALDWMHKAKAEVPKAANAFEREVAWVIREAMFRAHDKNDPQLRPLLKDAWNRYGVKLPQLREHLVQICEMHGIQDPPWDTPELVTSASEPAATSGGLWTPGSDSGPAANEGGESKLWVPGQ
ncbi:MAG: hypothetical protein CMJ78_13525 [Planctomycetaceae bacterium]|nr:hypothetical protein [Planctomycetaceae bacterium]